MSVGVRVEVRKDKNEGGVRAKVRARVRKDKTENGVRVGKDKNDGEG